MTHVQFLFTKTGKKDRIILRWFLEIRGIGISKKNFNFLISKASIDSFHKVSNKERSSLYWWNRDSTVKYKSRKQQKKT